MYVACLVVWLSRSCLLGYAESDTSCVRARRSNQLFGHACGCRLAHYSSCIAIHHPAHVQNLILSHCVTVFILHQRAPLQRGVRLDGCFCGQGRELGPASERSEPDGSTQDAGVPSCSMNIVSSTRPPVGGPLATSARHPPHRILRQAPRIAYTGALLCAAPA